ncbi:MAG TPA: hypothetical protein VJG32_22440 [Anaerolineae bacterium]|nr:hypothetical protein [Anaerolineae bacterium]
MNSHDRSSIIVAVILILLGVLFLAYNLIPGLNIGRTWPAIFFLIAAGFYLPPFIWPSARQGLAALFIPGSIMIVLGLIFTYNTVTDDWASWAYAWTLIPAGVGLGLALAARFGAWGRSTLWTGIWMIVVSTIVFGFFGTLFGGAALKSLGPILLIAGGVLLLLRSFIRPTRPA